MVIFEPVEHAYMNKILHFLLLEDVPTDAQIIEHELRKGNFLFVLKRVTTEKAFREALEEFKPDIILADYKLPVFDGISALRIAEKNCPDIPFIFVSGYRGEELAVESLKSGAKDYILKENLLRLVPSVRLALSERQEQIKRRQAEEALRKSKASLDNAQRIAHIGNWEWDIVKNQVLGSDEFYRIFGLTPQAFVGTHESFIEYVHPEDIEFVKKSVYEALYERKPYNIEFRIGLPDNSEKIVHSQGEVVFDDTGKAIQMNGIIQDLTERKQIAYQLEKQRNHLEDLNDKLAATNKELDAFSYSVSHDLSAPLNRIAGFCDILMEDYADKLDERGKNYLHRVITNGKYMAQLIKDMLYFARAIRGKKNDKTINLSALAKKIANELQENQTGRQVEFIIADELVTKGDPQLMQIVLDNLLRNAWKFTGKRPHARIEFGETQKDGKQIYFVRDNGVGFDMANVDKLFNPFKRLHSTADFEGNGIGLATVRRIIKRHNGRIWAEGVVDQGATFYFTL